MIKNNLMETNQFVYWILETVLDGVKYKECWLN